MINEFWCHFYRLRTVSAHKRRFGCNEGPAAKQARTIYPAYFIPELAHVVAMCDEKLPFYVLAQALNKRKLAHSGLQVEANSTSLVLGMLTLPMPEVQPTDKVTPSIMIETFYVAIHGYVMLILFVCLLGNRRISRSSSHVFEQH